jgi:hypothetical protein
MHRFYSAITGVGRFTISSARRGTMRPPGNRTNTVSTTSLLGSWNDDVFSGSMDDGSFLAGFEIEDPITSRMRAKYGTLASGDHREGFVRRF